MPIGRLRRRVGTLRFQAKEAARSLWYRLPFAASRRYVRELWDNQAEMIHATWGNDDHDFAVIGRLITSHHVASILDVGCGSGRLFRLYRDRGVQDIVGIDISEKALAIGRDRFPDVRTMLAPVEELPIEGRRFDLAVCNRVLQHVPPLNMRRVSGRLARTAKRIYVNELSGTDGERENFYMMRHDYPALFAEHGCRLIEEGRIGVQRYLVFDTPDQP